MKLSVNTVICATLILIFIYLFLLYHDLPNKTHNKYCNCNVYIKTSNVGGGFGRGIFAKKKFFKGDIIEYGPGLKGTAEQMFCGIYRDYVYECKDDPPNEILALGYGSIYNHSKNNNASMKIDGHSFYVVANRDIEKDEEIFTHYGDNIWFSDRGITEI